MRGAESHRRRLGAQHHRRVARARGSGTITLKIAVNPPNKRRKTALPMVSLALKGKRARTAEHRQVAVAKLSLAEREAWARGLARLREGAGEGSE